MITLVPWQRGERPGQPRDAYCAYCGSNTVALYFFSPFYACYDCLINMYEELHDFMCTTTESIDIVDNDTIT